MSEKLSLNSEHAAESISHTKKEVEPENHNKTNQIIEDKSSDIESLILSAKQEALSSSETHLENAHENSPTPSVIQKHHKKLAYKQTLRSVRRQLPATDKIFSHIIHQPVVEKLSDFSSKTIARPSGLLSAGILALAGNAILLYMSRHYGFKYNYLFFVLFLSIGYLLGIIIEILIRNFNKKNKEYN